MKRIVTETAAQTYAIRMRNSLSFGKGSVLLSSSSPLNQEALRAVRFGSRRGIAAALRNLRKKAPLLLGGVVQLGETVRHFHSRNVYFESFRQRRIFRLLFRKRRDIRRKIVKNRGLDKFVFGHGFEKEACPLAVLQRAFGRGVRRTGALRPQVVASCRFLSAARRA